MTSELKVYNSFGELTLHLRASSENGPQISTVDGTPEMRSAITSLRGTDFDRTVVKSNELSRLTANWGSPAYLSTLGRYFVANFGWRTKLVETEESSASLYSMASGTFASPIYYYCTASGSPAANTMVTVNISEDRPDTEPTTNLPIASRAASANVFSGY
jgi:hypothetical protein